MALRTNPLDKQTAFFGIKPTQKSINEVTQKAITKVEQILKFEKIGLDPSETFQRIIAADPSTDKNYTKYLLDVFARDPRTVLDDLSKATEYLKVFYREQDKPRMADWAKVAVTAKNFPLISDLLVYLQDNKAIIKGLIDLGQWTEDLKTGIRNGDLVLLDFDEDVIFVDVITEAGDCIIGSKEWCTTRGAFAGYKAGGLIVMKVINDAGVSGLVQFTAQTENPGSNGVFNEAKDSNDREIKWSNYPAKFLKKAKEMSKIVLQRIKATSFLTPITTYLQNSNDPIYKIIKERYQNAKLLPIEFIERHQRELISFFNHSDANSGDFKEKFNFLVTGIDKDILLIECLVRKMKGISEGMIYLDMKSIPGGKHQFQNMEVILDAFEMNAFETTNALWLYVMGEEAKGSWDDYVPIGLPKVNVSWYDCINFCNRLSILHGLQPVYQIKGDDVNWIWDANGYRLPSEAEWEAAARARSNFTYAGSDNVDEVAWYSGNSDNRRHRVGLKKANGYGLYDMSGNVSEWVYDSYSSDPRDKEEHPLRDPSLAQKSNPRMRKNYQPLYLLKVTQGQYSFLTEFYGGQTSATYSVLSRWKREKGNVGMTRELLEQFMTELARIHHRGGLNARQQKSLDALYNKAAKLLQ